jgi:queuine tRNA-ribosyltransferase
VLTETTPEPTFSPSFHVEQADSRTRARLGTIQLAHGPLQTPVFMPVGTHGTVRGISAHLLHDSQSQVMLCNTYHLFARPGIDLIEKMGGLHRFNSWNRNILTDSGGFQVFSLAANRKISDEGVEFQNPRNGDRLHLNPEKVVRIQERWGSDVMMVLDECPPATATAFEVDRAVDRTTQWARRSRESRSRFDLAMFPIVQGGSFPELRQKSLKALMDLEKGSNPWEGLAIGGMSVGEEKQKFVKTLYDLRSSLPSDRPVYLMGVGTPRDLVFAVACGVDMFDCVLPSRNGRHGIVMTRHGRLNIMNNQFHDDPLPPDPTCACPTCSKYSRSFIRHLLYIEDGLGGMLLTLHNIYYFLNLMSEVRAHIQNGTFLEFATEFLNDPRNIFLGSEKGFNSYPQSF